LSVLKLGSQQSLQSGSKLVSSISNEAMVNRIFRLGIRGTKLELLPSTTGRNQLTRRSTDATSLQHRCFLLALSAYHAEQVYASVGRPSVRLSVCPSMGPQQQTRCCRFAAEQTCLNIDLSNS